MTFDVLRLLEEEGYIKDGEDNVVHAEKAFFAARVMRWIRNRVETNPDFNLQAYLTMLLYYKTGVADLSFSENEDKLLYKMKNPDQEMHEIVDTLIKTFDKPSAKKDTDNDPESAQSPDRDSDS